MNWDYRIAVKDAKRALQHSNYFVQAAKKYIEPVVVPYGFACTKVTPHVVEYRSDEVTVSVYHSLQSHEVSLTIARNSDLYSPHHLSDLVHTSTEASQDDKDALKISGTRGIINSVTVIAELLQKYGAPYLRGDTAAYERMKGLAQVRNERPAMDQQSKTNRRGGVNKGLGQFFSREFHRLSDVIACCFFRRRTR